MGVDGRSGLLPRKTVIWHLKDKWEFGEVRGMGSRGKGAACPNAQKECFRQGTRNLN